VLLKKLWDKGWQQIQAGWKWLKDVGEKVGGEVKKYIGDVWDKLMITLGNYWDGTQKFFADMFQPVTDGVNWLLNKFNFSGKGAPTTARPNEGETKDQRLKRELKAYTEKQGGSTGKQNQHARLQQFISSSADNSIDVDLATQLAASGFSVPQNAIRAKVVQSGSPPITGSQSASTPAASKPITATPSTGDGTSGNTSEGNSGVKPPAKQTGGMTMSSIPTYAGDPTLVALNQSWSTA
jgi:hypothetical protein